MTEPNILPGLESLLVPLENLRHLPGNARKGNPEAIAKSLKQFGQHRALVARKTGMGSNGYPEGEVLIGNHMFKAAISLGWTHIAVIWTDDDEVTAKARALADNRASDLGVYDEDALAEMIADVLEADEALLEAASFSIDDLDALLGETATSPQDLENDEDDDEAISPDPQKSVAQQERPETKHATLSLFDRFLAPPFSVLNSREGWWQDRKNTWIALGLEGELGRDDKPRTWYMAAPQHHHHPDRPFVEMGAADRKRQEEDDE